MQIVFFIKDLKTRNLKDPFTFDLKIPVHKLTLVYPRRDTLRTSAS